MSEPSQTADTAKGESRHRVLFCITDLDVGGAENCLAHIVRHLDPSRWETHVCSLMPPGPLAKQLSEHAVSVQSLEMHKPRQLLGGLLRLRRLLRTLNPELMQTFLFHANILGRIAARTSGNTRVIANLRVAERRRYHHWLERLTHSLSVKTVCVSQSVSRFTQINARVGPSRLTVIANGVVVPERQPIRSNPGAVCGVCVARLEEQKGVDVLMRALPAVLRQVPEFRLRIAGTGGQRASLERLALELSVGESVEFLGYRADVARLLRESDLFILPSRWEGMPNAVLEAMANGCPVLATSVDGTSEIVTNRQTGLLVPPDQPDPLAAAILELTCAPELRSRIASAAFDYVKQQHGVEKMVAEYEKLYLEVLGRAQID